MKSSGTTPKSSVAGVRKFEKSKLKKVFLLFSHSFQLIMRLVTFVLNWIGVYTGCIAQGQDNIPFITVKLTLGGFKME